MLPQPDDQRAALLPIIEQALGTQHSRHPGGPSRARPAWTRKAE